MTTEVGSKHTILQDQNAPIQITRLGAQRLLYSRAKLIAGLQFFLSCPVTILAGLAAWHYPEVRPCALGFGFAVFLVDVFLWEPMQRRYRHTATKIQEAFDCDVLQLPWNSRLARHKVDIAVESNYGAKYSEVAHKHKPLPDWYPVAVSQAPLSLARIVCQRTNCWWDSDQRRLYLSGVKALIVLIIAGSLFAGIVANESLRNYLLYFSIPMLPFWNWSYKQIKEHKLAIGRLNKVVKTASDVFESALENPDRPDLADRSRAVQDEIFEMRRLNPPLFDWVFNLLRNSREEHMNVTAQALVARIPESVASRSDSPRPVPSMRDAPPVSPSDY